jgi:hypothetical protein
MKTSLLFDTPLEEVKKGFNVYIHVEDEWGRRILSKKANTLVRGFYDILFGRFNTHTTVVDTGGTQSGISVNFQDFDVSAVSGSTSNGIVVGTSTSPVSMMDFRLGSLIAHGVGAGQLLYGSVGFTPIEIIGNMIRFQINRLLTNDSGNDITVNEVGLVGRKGTALAPRNVLLDRTLATFIVPNGSSRNVIYELRVVV